MIMVKISEYKTIDSIVLSNYILKHYGPMSHLKLQKLLYYCDAYSLAYFGEELITDQFEAWVHWPVDYDAAQLCHETISKKEMALYYKRDIA
ncbi:MAG: DUF4065 domain-containing protein [Prevotella sp.]|nr:DUF4065 domain-containing protein [Prevotella sp.]